MRFQFALKIVCKCSNYLKFETYLADTLEIDDANLYIYHDFMSRLLMFVYSYIELEFQVANAP